MRVRNISKMVLCYVKIQRKRIGKNNSGSKPV